MDKIIAGQAEGHLCASCCAARTLLMRADRQVYRTSTGVVAMITSDDFTIVNELHRMVPEAPCRTRSTRTPPRCCNARLAPAPAGCDPPTHDKRRLAPLLNPAIPSVRRRLVALAVLGVGLPILFLAGLGIFQTSHIARFLRETTLEYGEYAALLVSNALQSEVERRANAAAETARMAAGWGGASPQFLALLETDDPLLKRPVPHARRDRARAARGRDDRERARRVGRARCARRPGCRGRRRGRPRARAARSACCPRARTWAASRDGARGPGPPTRRSSRSRSRARAAAGLDDRIAVPRVVLAPAARGAAATR